MKRRKISFIIVVALAVSLLLAMAMPSYGATAPIPADNIVRVHLNSYGEPASVTMNAIGSYKILDNSAAVSGVFTVTASNGGIKIVSGANTWNLGGDIYIKAASLSVSNLIQINSGYSYAGDMRILNKNGTLKIVNYVDIETYVMGVIPYEMSNSWPIEALKAQAVAARTYAYYVMNSKVRTTVENDLVNYISHQVYYGYNASYANCIAAVNATKNTILKTPGGQIVYACYSASNGGMTENGTASGAAASNFDYLPVKDDPYDLAYALNTTAYSGKLLIPKTLAVNDLKNNAAQPYKMLRDKLNASGVDVGSISGDVAVKSIVLTNPNATGPDRQFTGASIVLGIPDSQDVTLSFGPVSVSGSSAKYPFLNEVLGLGDKFSMLALQDAGTNWLIASVRYGHGAGLSQIGSCQMANSGKTYQDILTFYYNLGSASTLVVMPWNTDGGTNSGVPGYTVTAVTKTGKVNTPGMTLNVRSGPGTGYAVLKTLNDTTKVTINGQVADWWQIDLGGGSNGFVSSAYITLDPDPQQPPATEQPSTPPSPPAATTKDGKVNTPGSTLNVRSGPGTTYSVIGSLKDGAKVTVSTENSAWYKLTYNGATGYVSAAFIVLDSTPAPAAPQTITVYVNTPGSTLNVRSGPGTGYAILGSLKHGDKITVTDEGGDWYKLTFNGKTGYVSKAWTKADNPVTTTPPTTPTTPTTPQSKTVYVNAAAGLNVRSGPGTTYSILGALANGSKITVTDENASWYKLTFNGKAGYVSKTYTSDTAPGQTATAPPAQKTGTVNSAIGLNIRSGAGTTYKIIGSLSNGAKITILDQSGSWYKINCGSSFGWVSSAYVKV